MRRLKVILPAGCKSRIFEIVLYIANDSVDKAFAFEARMLAAIRGLGEFHGHAIDEAASERMGLPLHKVVFEGVYLIHYWVDLTANAVVVLSVRHGARKPGPNQP